MGFEFLREGRVWVEYNSQFYLLHTTRDIQFSQTFKQSSVRKKTLHRLQDNIDGSSITSANPANFSFVMYLLDETVAYQKDILGLLIQLDPNDTTKYLKEFNLYFVYADYSPQVYYKIENCFFSSGSFTIPRNGLMTVELSGEGSRLTRVTGSLPGSIYAGYLAEPAYAISKAVDVHLGGTSATDKLDNIASVAFEIQNSVSWNINTTIHKSLLVTDASNTIYPEKFTLTGRTMAGSIKQYIDSSNDQSHNNLLTWKEGTTLHIKAGLSSNNYQFELTLNNNASFTNRSDIGEVFTQNYDFRLMDNNFLSWSNIIKYN